MNAPNTQANGPAVPTAKLGQGNVPLFLAGREYTLKPSLGAIQAICSKYGGLQDVMNRIANVDFNVVLDVVAVGIGGPFVSSMPQRQKLAEALYESGLTDTTGGICNTAQSYVIILMRGGRPLPKPGEAEDTSEVELGAEPKNPLSSSSF